MLRRALALLTTLVLGMVPAPGEPVVILKGTDPTQFELVGLAPDSITIVDGEVRLTGKPLGYFATKQEYKNYVLTFEYRYDRPDGLKSDADFRGNSGVLLHVTKPHKVWPSCVQVQLAQADPGSIFSMGEAKCDAASDPLAQKAAVKPVGDWNKVRITCRNGGMTCLLNGAEVGKAEKAEPTQGVIGWQSEGKPIRFREIRIEVLP